MAYKLTAKEFDDYLKALAGEYLFIAPVVCRGKGAFTDTDSVRYQEIKSLDEIELARKSDFSAREILTPISQTLFYFTEDNWTEPKVSDKKVLLFLRSCDIHAIRRLDDIYLRNGAVDPYYKVLRDKIRLCLIECRDSFPNCFCVSMNTNVTDEYDMLLRREGDSIYVGLKNSELDRKIGEAIELSPRFVMENHFEVAVPEGIPLAMATSPLWEEYSARCIGCGRCSFVCPTCSCFSMQDIFYKDNRNAGERRRVWASCMVDGYTDMAGGHAFRKKQGDRMRFRVMHKINDYKKRFGCHMCVGCGRCDDACPEYISFSSCVNKLSKAAAEEKK